jgi:hypothetical protein
MTMTMVVVIVIIMGIIMGRRMPPKSVKINVTRGVPLTILTALRRRKTGKGPARQDSPKAVATVT